MAEREAGTPVEAKAEAPPIAHAPSAPPPPAGIAPTGIAPLPPGAAIGTTFVAGFVDAIGFAHLAGLYLSFMSGNSTALAVAMASGDAATAGAAFAVIACFVLGVFLATLVGERPGTRARTIYAIEVAALAVAGVAAVLATGWVTALPAVLAMGMQNVLLGRIAGADLGKGYVTGTLVGVGQGLARAWTRRRFPATGLVHLAGWAVFVAGAVTGTLVLGGLGWPVALWTAAALAAALCLHAVIGDF